MPYTIKTKDGVVIRNIPDEIDPNSNQAREMVMKARADRAAQSISPEQRTEDLNSGTQAGNAKAPEATNANIWDVLLSVMTGKSF